MKNLIFIASKGNNVGKTTTAKLYSEHSNLSSEIYSFANPIKDCCDNIFKTKYKFESKFTEFYNNRKLKNNLIRDHYNIKEFIELDNLTFRQFLNNLSTRLAAAYGQILWAEKALTYIEKSKSELILVDDFRREIEIDYLVNNLNKENYNIITVYLVKDSVKNQVKTEYEGLLEDYKFDIVFNIDNDYSNMNDLLKIIDNKII